MTADAFFRLSKILLAATFVSPAFAQAGPFAACEDPTIRRQMSTLEAAFAGPLYSSQSFQGARQRFDENMAEQASPKTGVPPSDLSEIGYLHELEFTARRATMESLVQMMWEVYDAQALPGSNFRVEETHLPWQASALICQKDCPTEVRERLRAEAAQIVKRLKSEGVPRRGVRETAQTLSISAEGLTQVLAAAFNGNGQTRLSDYYLLLTQTMMSGVGRLWLSPRFHETLGLPTAYEKMTCLVEKKCELPKPPTFTDADVRRALQEYYQQLLYQNIRRDNFVFDEAFNQKEIRKRIVEFYRYSPLVVAKLAAEQPIWSRYLCPYLSAYLSERGSDQTWELDTNEILRLLPMGGFWLIGLTSGMRNGGKISPMAFAFATIVGFAKIGIDTYKLSEEKGTLTDVRGYAMSGQVDTETLLRYFNTLEIYEKKKDERDKEAMEEAAMAAFSFTLARVMIYGVRGAMTAKVTGDLVWKGRNSRAMFDFLRQHRIHNPEELRQFLTHASGHEMAEIKELLKTGYEYSVPGAIMSIYEVWKSFNFKSYEIEELERTL